MCLDVFITVLKTRYGLTGTMEDLHAIIDANQQLLECIPTDDPGLARRCNDASLFSLQ